MKLTIAIVDTAFLLTLSDVFANLSAGWFGTAFVIPLTSDGNIENRVGILTVDIGLGIFCFVVSYLLRKYRRDDD